MATAAAHPTVLTKDERANQRNAVLAGFLGWTLDAFDFFVLTFVVQDVATAFGKTRPDILLTVSLALAMRPIGALIFGLIADRFGRRLPLMLNVIFYAVISVLSGLAPSYQVFLILRMLFGIGMGGEWGVGASLALESTPTRFRGLLSGLLQEGYAMGNLLAALAFRLVYVPVHAAHPDYAWRVMFFIGGLPALLSLFIRAKVKESEAWQEHRTDWTTYRRSLWKHWPRFLFIVLLMTMMNFMSHGTQDLYPTFLQTYRGYTRQRHGDAHDDLRRGRHSGRAVLRVLLRPPRPPPGDDHLRVVRAGRGAAVDCRAQRRAHRPRRISDAVLRAGRLGRHPGAHQRAVAGPLARVLPGVRVSDRRRHRLEHRLRSRPCSASTSPTRNRWACWPRS